MSDFVGKKDIIQAEQINAEIGSVVKSFEGLKKTIGDVAKSAIDMQNSLGGKAAYLQLIAESKQLAENTKALNDAKKEELRLQALLVKNKLAEQKKAEAAATKALAAEQKKELALNAQSLKIRTNIAKQKLAEQKKAEAAATREATKAAKEQAKVDAELAKKKNGLLAAFKNLAKSVVGYMIALASVQRIMQFFTRDLLELNKKLDSQNFSMKTVIRNTTEYNQTVVFLSETAKNYGQDILVLTERYIKFRAATMQTNMSAQDTQRIFNSTAKAAAVLGLKTDEVNGVFLALEQMISKGKVTTEELRRQLGERLPGAMGIMAKAMNVSISELDGMLKKGEVLSDYALPKFARALEEAYGIESVNKVDTLASAQGRLRTSWIELVQTINTSSSYIKVLNFFSSIISKIREDVRGIADIQNEMSVDMVSGVLRNVTQLDTKEERMKYLADEILKIQKKQDFYRGKAVVHAKNLSDTEAKMAKALSTVLFGSELGYEKRIKLFIGYEGALLRNTESLEYYNNMLFASKQAMAELSDSLKELSMARDPITVFDLEGTLEKVKKAKQSYEEFGKLAETDLSELNKIEKDLLLQSGDNFEEHVQKKITDIEGQFEAAAKLYAKEQAILNTIDIKDKKRFEEQTNRAVSANDNLKNLHEAHFRLKLMLVEDEKKVENDRLRMLRLRNKAEIEHNKAAAEQIIRERAKLLEKEVMTDIQKNDVLLDLREKLDKDILERQLALEEEIRDLGGWTAKERMDIEKQVADYTNDLEKDATDSFINNIKRENDKLDEQFKLLQLLHEARLEQVKAQTGTQRGSEGAAIEANYSFQEYKEIQFAEMKLRLRQQEIDAEIAMIEEQKTKLRKEEFAETEKLNGQIEKLRKESADNIADYQIKKMEEVTNFEREQIVYRLGIELLNDEINKFAEVRNKILDGDWFEAENKLADAANKVLKMIIGKKKYSKEQINQMLIDANRALLKNEIETLREFLKIDERTIDEFINNEHKIAEALNMSVEEWEDYAAAAGIDPEEYQTKYKELLEIIKEFLQKEIDLIANPENSLKDWLKVVQDMVNSLFDIIDAYYERRRQAAENLYKAETKYAGTSVEQKLEAERKLDKELTKIRKKQSIAQKMQSIFNIGLQNLEAIPKAAGGDPLAIAQLIAAGLAMTAVIAEPIPAYEKGGKHKKSGLAKVSEKGQEIFIDNKTGKSYLTPKDETIAHFPAGEFIPHDETQRLLANYAMSQTREMVDMTNTNKYLSSIANNTKNTQSVNYVDGYKIVKRNGVTSKIKI